MYRLENFGRRRFNVRNRLVFEFRSFEDSSITNIIFGCVLKKAAECEDVPHDGPADDVDVVAVPGRCWFLFLLRLPCFRNQLSPS